MCETNLSASRKRSTIQTQYNKKKKENFFIAETNDREKTSKTLNNYMTVLSYVGKTLLFLPGVGSGASTFQFATVVRAPTGIACASFSLVFLASNGILKIYLKTV